MADKFRKGVNADPNDKGCEPDGPPTEFYLARDQGMDPNKPYAHTFNYNGWEYTIRFGQRNTLPKQVAEYIRDLGKEGTKVPNLKKYDPTQGGVPRADSDFDNPDLIEEPSMGRFQVEML